MAALRCVRVSNNPIRPGDYVVFKSNPRHVIFVTDVGPRTRGERNVRGGRMFYGFSRICVLYTGARPEPILNEDVTSYRHATDEEIAEAAEAGVLPPRP